MEQCICRVSAVGKELEAMVELLNSAGFTTYTLNDNPTVKNHLRYMVSKFNKLYINL